MPTDPLTGSRYPAASAAPNVAQDIQNAVIDLADNTVTGPWATTAARDLAYSNWVTAGGVMREGLYCHVTSIGLMVYTSGAWRRATPQRGIATFLTDASGLGTITHTLGITPSVVQLTPIFTTDGISGVMKPTVGAVSSSTIQVVTYRTDTSARLLTTNVSMYWEAWP